MQITRKGILNSALDDWEARGLISSELHETLLSDTFQGGHTFNFGRIVLILAAICLGFAAMTFVAANWIDIPRLARLAIILGSMWAAWAFGIFMLFRDRRFLAEIGALLGSGIYGAAIMLIAQMYHIQGEATDAVRLWALGCIIAAALTRLQMPLALGICLYILLLFIDWRDDHARLMLGLYLLICAALSVWTKSRFNAHLCAIFFGAWFIWLVMDHGPGNLVFSLGAFLIIGMGLFFNSIANKFDFGAAAINYPLVLSGIMVFVHYVETVIDPNGLSRLLPDYSPPFFYVASLIVVLAIIIGLAVFAWRTNKELQYEQVILAVFSLLFTLIHLFLPKVPFLPELFILAVSIWVIRMGGRLEQKFTVALGVIWFIGFLIVIYFSPIGSLLGTSLFFALVGINMIGLVFFIPRVWKHKGEPT